MLHLINNVVPGFTKSMKHNNYLLGLPEPKAPRPSRTRRVILSLTRWTHRVGLLRERPIDKLRRQAHSKGLTISAYMAKHHPVSNWFDRK